MQQRLFLRAKSAQQQRQGRRLFLLSVLGAEATTKFQLATEAAFQWSVVVHTTKVSTPDWPVSRRFIFQHRLLASRLNKSLYDTNGTHECLLNEVLQMIYYINIKR